MIGLKITSNKTMRILMYHTQVVQQFKDVGSVIKIKRYPSRPVLLNLSWFVAPFKRLNTSGPLLSYIIFVSMIFHT